MCCKPSRAWGEAAGGELKGNTHTLNGEQNGFLGSRAGAAETGANHTAPPPPCFYLSLSVAHTQRVKVHSRVGLHPLCLELGALNAHSVPFRTRFAAPKLPAPTLRADRSTPDAPFCPLQPCLATYLKGILHPKMKMWSFFTYPHVVPNQQKLSSSSEHNLRYFG